MRQKAATGIAAAALVGALVLPLVANPAAASASTRPPAARTGSPTSSGLLNPADPHFVGSVPHLPRGAVRLGPMNSSASLNLDVSLIPAHHQELAQFLQDLYSPGNPQYHKFLAPGQFAQAYGAPTSVVTQVTQVLSGDGMSVGKISPNGLVLPVTTTVGTAESVFGVSLAQVRMANGKLAHSNTTAPQVPASIKPFVQGIVGLDSAAVPQPLVAAAPTVTCVSTIAACGSPNAAAPDGPIGGGTTVYVTGSGFYCGGVSSCVSAVDFGTSVGTRVNVGSDTSLTVVSPPSNTASIVDITVTTTAGTSSTGLADQFTYLDICVTQCAAVPATPSQNAPCDLAPGVAAANQAYLTGDSSLDTPNYPYDELYQYYGFGYSNFTGTNSGAILPTRSNAITPEEGLGQTVAVFEQAAYSAADVSQYQSCFGVPTSITELNGTTTPELTNVAVDGGTNQFDPEANLDIELLMSLVPEAALRVYTAPATPQGWIDDLNAIVNDTNLANVVSISYGLCELDQDQGTLAAENTIFEQAAAQGQTVLASAGDTGSEACSFHAGSSGGNNTQLAVSDPASQPYVTGVGGTSYDGYQNPSTETVWNDSSGAGGGGISTEWQMPSWQQGFGVVNSSSSGSPCGASSGNYCREVPDVSANADPQHGYVIYNQGQWSVVGGTSAAAPLWSGFVALQNQTCTLANDGTPTETGFANPRLYALAESNASEALFDPVSGAPEGYLRDIFSGNNDMTGSNQGSYPAFDPAKSATAGYYYSMAAGLGSPTGALFDSAHEVPLGATLLGEGYSSFGGSFPAVSPGLLCDNSALPPIVTSVSPNAGSPSGGPPLVTITGNNFTGVTAVTFAGSAGSSQATSFKVISDNEIEAVPPPSPSAQSSYTVDITISEGTTTSTPNPPYDRYTYTSAPVVIAVTSGAGTSPTGNSACAAIVSQGTPAAPYGPAAGGQQVTACGYDLTGVTSAYFFTGNKLACQVTGSQSLPTGCSGSTNSSTLTCSQLNQASPVTYASASNCYLASPTSLSASSITSVPGVAGLQQVTVTTPADPGVSPLYTCDLTDLVLATPSASSSPNPGFDISGGTGCPPGAIQESGTASTGDEYGFTDQPIVTSISATVAPMQGDVSLTIHGFNFTSSAGYISSTTACTNNPAIIGVGFGTVSMLGNNCRVLSDTLIAVQAPPALFPGTVDVQVDLQGTQSTVIASPSVAADRFTYVTCSASYATSSAIGIANVSSGAGYLVADGTGRVAACGTASYYGSAADPFGYDTVTQAPALPAAYQGCPYSGMLSPTNFPVKNNDWIVGMASSPGLDGYWEADTEGNVYPFGNAAWYGDAGKTPLICPIVAISATADGGGYWLVASDGSVYAFGDAPYYGGANTIHLDQPIVGMASTPTGGGYWLVAADGGVFAFGDSAPYFGSMGGTKLDQPIVGMASTPTGAGYWLVAADGGVFTFGDASYNGAARCYAQYFKIDIGGMVTGMTPTPDGGGYWLVSQTGNVLPFGDARFEGTMSPGGSMPPTSPGGDTPTLKC